MPQLNRNETIQALALETARAYTAWMEANVPATIASNEAACTNTISSLKTLWAADKLDSTRLHKTGIARDAAAKHLETCCQQLVLAARPLNPQFFAEPDPERFYVSQSPGMGPFKLALDAYIAEQAVAHDLPQPTTSYFANYHQLRGMAA